MVQDETSGKTCFGIDESQPIDAERAGRGEYDRHKSEMLLIVSTFDTFILLRPMGISSILEEEFSLDSTF